MISMGNILFLNAKKSNYTKDMPYNNQHDLIITTKFN